MRSSAYSSAVRLAWQHSAIMLPQIPKGSLIGYGHFHQLVIPSPAGHVSIAFEPGANPAGYLEAILGVMADHGRPAA